MKTFNFLKTFEKFLRGGALATIATAAAFYWEKDPKVLVPLFVGLGEAVFNVLKFFLTKNE